MEMMDVENAGPTPMPKRIRRSRRKERNASNNNRSIVTNENKTNKKSRVAKAQPSKSATREMVGRPYTKKIVKQDKKQEKEIAVPDETLQVRAGRRRVFVSNLKWQTKEEGLKSHMQVAGDIINARIMRTRTGRSAGAAVVEYTTPLQAANAIRTLHDSFLEGRKIIVRLDKEEKEIDSETNQVYVGNLAWSVTEEDLHKIFSAEAPIKNISLPQTKRGTNRGNATITYSSSADARNAIEKYNGCVVNGRPIEVREFTSNPSAFSSHKKQ